jgi:uncharacterized membrane protein YebE (DUF533 family)
MSENKNEKQVVVEGKVTEEAKVETKVETPVEPTIMVTEKKSTVKEDLAQIGKGLCNLGKKAVSGVKKAAPWVAGIGVAALAAKVYSDYQKSKDDVDSDETIVDGEAEEMSTEEDSTTADF